MAWTARLHLAVTDPGDGALLERETGHQRPVGFSVRLADRHPVNCIVITLLGSGLLLLIRPLPLMSASAPFSHDLPGNAPSAASLRARTPPAGDEVGNHQQQIPVAVAECFIDVRADGGGQYTDEGSGGLVDCCAVHGVVVHVPHGKRWGCREPFGAGIDPLVPARETSRLRSISSEVTPLPSRPRW